MQALKKSNAKIGGWISPDGKIKFSNEIDFKDNHTGMLFNIMPEDTVKMLESKYEGRNLLEAIYNLAKSAGYVDFLILQELNKRIFYVRECSKKIPYNIQRKLAIFADKNKSEVEYCDLVD